MSAEKFKQQRKEKVKQNRTKRREESMKEFGRATPNSSDKAYIEGNTRKVASNRAYGHNKDISEGGEGNLNIQSIRKQKELKRQYKTNERKKYAIMSSANPNANKFTEHLNTFKADGLSTAKANQQKGKHIKNAGQWVAGGIKDAIIDPVVDVMKGADYGMGQITGAVSGALEQSGNIFTSIAEGKNNINKGLIRRNMEESRKESDATGWGHGFGKYFNDVADRSDEKYNIQQTEQEKTKRQNILNIAGLGADILNPITIEGALKPLTKGVTSSFNDMIKGTADVSTGFVPKELTNLKGQYSNKLRKASGASDDVFYNGKAIENTAETARLDNAYKNAVNKTEPIKTGKTKLDGFLSQLKQRRVGNAEEGGMFSYNAKPIDMQGKPRNVPNPISDINKTDDLGSYNMSARSNAGNAEYTPKGRYSAETGKDMAQRLDLESQIKEIDDIMESYGGNYELEDRFMDTLQKSNPKLYNEYMKVSDISDEIIGNNEAKQLLNDNYTKSVNEKLGNNIKDRRTINVDNTKPLTSAPIQARKSLGENSVRFKNFTQHYVDQKLPKMSFAEKEMTIATLKDMSRKTTKSNQDKTIQALNKMLFDGENVIRNNVPKHDLKQFSNYMIDTITYQDALDNGVAKIKIHNKDGKLVNFNVFDKKGNVNQLENKINMFANNMVDDLFEDKKSIKANAVGVKYKSEITKPLDALDKKREKVGLTPAEQKKYTDLKMREELWDAIHRETRDLEFDEFNKYVENKFPHLSQNKAYKDVIDERANDINLRRNERFDKLTDEQKLEKRELDIKKSEDAKRRKETLELANKMQRNEQMGLKYVDTKYPIKIPKNVDAYEYISTRGNSQIALQNLSKLIKQEVFAIANGTNQHNADAIRELIKRNVGYLDKLGIDRNVYFERIQNYKKKAISDAYNKSKELGMPNNTNGMQINRKGDMGGNALEELARKQMFDDEYEKILEATNIDELLLGAETPKYKEYSLQHGDNVGKSISQETIPDITDLSKNNASNMPLNKIPKDKQVDKLKELDDKINSRLTPERMSEILGTPLDDFFANASKNPIIAGEEITPGWRKNANKGDVGTDVDMNKIGKSTYTPSKPTRTSVSDSSKVGDELAMEVEELAKSGVDASKQPPKEKPKDMSPSLYKKWLNAWKKGVTVYSPGWHVQNFFQNKGQNYLALGNEAFAPQTKARKLLKEMNSDGAKSALADKAKELNVLGEFGEDFTPSKNNILKKIENSKLLESNEQTARLHHWLTQMDRGMTPEDALESVNKYLFDYSGKNDTKVDKFIKERIDPFWTFHKNNAKLMVDSGMRHPTRMGNIRRGVDGLDDALTDENRQSEESSYGRTQLPGATYHDNVSNADFNYMYKQQTLPEFEDGIPTTQEDFENKMNPLLRMALQTAKGEGNFGNKLTTNEEAEWGETTIPDRLKEIAMELNPILPTLFNTIDKSKSRQEKADNDKVGQEITDKQILNDWIKYITGHKGNWYRNM